MESLSEYFRASLTGLRFTWVSIFKNKHPLSHSKPFFFTSTQNKCKKLYMRSVHSLHWTEICSYLAGKKTEEAWNKSRGQFYVLISQAEKDLILQPRAFLFWLRGGSSPGGQSPFESILWNTLSKHMFLKTEYQLNKYDRNKNLINFTNSSQRQIAFGCG